MSDLLRTTLRDVPVAVLDFEMTGLDPERDRVCEVAVVRGRAGAPERSWQTLVRPDVRMSKGARKVTGITEEMLQTAPPFVDVVDELLEVLDGTVMVCHNVPFDIGFLHREMDQAGRRFRPPVSLDTLTMARRLFAFRRNTLENVCDELGIVHAPHRAMSDAEATFAVFSKMVGILDPEGDVTVGEIIDLVGALAPNSPLRLRQQQILRDAYRERRTVFIDYQSTGDPFAGVVHREVALWALNLPYMQGWCYLREGERIFRLDRCRRVAPAGQRYEIPDFDVRI